MKGCFGSERDERIARYRQPLGEVKYEVMDRNLLDLSSFRIKVSSYTGDASEPWSEAIIHDTLCSLSSSVLKERVNRVDTQGM